MLIFSKVKLEKFKLLKMKLSSVQFVKTIIKEIKNKKKRAKHQEYIKEQIRNKNLFLEQEISKEQKKQKDLLKHQQKNIKEEYSEFFI